jgi:hypothetical protein
MNDLSNLIQGVIFFGGAGFLIVLFVWILVIYLVITAWYNIKHTRTNTEKIVALLSDFQNRNNCNPLGQENLGEASVNSAGESDNEADLEKNINNYDAWWNKLNPPGRQPETNILYPDESKLATSNINVNPYGNGIIDDVGSDKETMPKEKWWNRKIF